MTPERTINQESQNEQSRKSQQRIGLVLSGGGVRGVAHLGVLKVLEEIGIGPAIISGTSAGGLVGALYAAGHGIGTILDFFKTTSIFAIGNFTARKPGIIDSDKFYPVLKEFFADDDFSVLKKKFCVTATDIIHGRSRTFTEGQLIKPLLASAAVPVVFSPVEIDGTLYTDGGALNNFPIEAVMGQCESVIGVNVHPLRDIKPENIRTTLSVMERILHLTVYYHSIQKYHLCNTVIAPQALAEFGTFDREHVDEVYEIGYREALEKKEELACLKNRILQ